MSCGNTDIQSPTFSPSTQTTIDTTIFKNFNGVIYHSKTYTKIKNEEPTQFLNTESRIGISDDKIIISCTTFKVTVYIKRIESDQISGNKLYHVDYSLDNKENFDSLLLYDKDRNMMFFYHNNEKIYFYDLEVK